VMRDHETYVYTARSITRLGHLESVAAEILADFQASIFLQGIGPL